MREEVVEAAYLSEREIIQRVLSGHRDDFRHLVTAHQDKVYSMVMRQSGDPNIARELTQEAFVKAYLALPRFRFNSSFSTWLIRIALNTMQTYFSSKAFREQQCMSSLDANKQAEVHFGQDINQTENTGPTEVEVYRLQQQISKLKSRYREVIVLCFLENKTYEEAAAILQIPRGTVCSRMNKAFKLLKAGLIGA